GAWLNVVGHDPHRPARPRRRAAERPRLPEHHDPRTPVRRPYRRGQPGGTRAHADDVVRVAGYRVRHGRTLPSPTGPERNIGHAPPRAGAARSALTIRQIVLTVRSVESFVALVGAVVLKESDRYPIVSTDGHVGADVFGYKPYLDARWHDEF